MPAALDLTGQRFGRLVALRKAPSRARCSHWWCRCDCGNVRSVATQSLRGEHTLSCGCYQRECAAEAGRGTITHGKRWAAEYSVYCGMKRRCENKNEKAYKRYGALGVECRFTGFEEFFSEVGARPSNKHQIDRIDPAGHYEPGNVRWATVKRQARNKRNTKYVTINGQRKCLADWCDEYGADYRLVWNRIEKLGWPPLKALQSKAHQMKHVGGLF